MRKQEDPVVATAENKDEEEIRRLIANWSKALIPELDGQRRDSPAELIENEGVSDLCPERNH